MNYVDIAAVAVIAGFGFFGLWFGLMHAFFSLIGMVAGLFFAVRFYEPMANWLISITGWGSNFSKVLMFVLAFILIARLVSLAVWVVEKILSIFTKLPVVSGLNHLLGGLFGLAEGVLVVGVSLYFIARFPLAQNFMTAVNNSTLAPYLVKPVKILLPLIPDTIQYLQSTVKNIF